MTGGVAGAWRHLDVYLTMAVSLVLGVLGMLNVVNSAMLAGATLAMLGLVGAASLGGRLQVTSLGEATAELANLVRERPEGAVSVPVSRAGLWSAPWSSSLVCESPTSLLPLTRTRL